MRRIFKVIRWVLGIGLLVTLIGGGIAVFVVPKISKAIAAQREKAAGPAVEVDEVAKGRLVRTISAPGTVAPKTDVEISSRVAAKVARLPFKEGEQVKAGDVVVELDAKDLQAELDAQRGRLLAEQASLKLSEAQLAGERAAMVGVKAAFKKATDDLERTQQLFATGDVSRSELDAAIATRDTNQSTYEARLETLKGAEASVAASAARVQIAEADVKRSEENLSYAIITSPIDGYITQLNAEVGEIVVVGTMNNQGTVIMKIADLSEMLVEARLAEVDVSRVKEGQKVGVIINGYTGRTFDGILQRVALQSRVQTADGTTYFEAEVLLDTKGERVYSGLTANVDIEVEAFDDTLIVPSQAVVDKRVDELPRDIRENNPLVDRNKTFAQVVYVFDNGKAKLHPVKTIASNLNKAALAEGIDVGTKIIVGPLRTLQTLANGDTVRLAKDDESLDAGGDEAKSGGGGPPGGRRGRRG